MKPQNVPQVAKDLEAAKAVLQKYGWTQGKMGYIGVGFCMLGAIERGVPFSRRKAVQDMLASVIRSPSQANCNSRPLIMRYNDRRKRMKATILKVFDKAIMKVRTQALEKVL